MSKGKKAIRVALFATLLTVAVSLFANALLMPRYGERQYLEITALLSGFLERYPEDEQKTIELLKSLDEADISPAVQHRLDVYGFGKEAFLRPYQSKAALFSIGSLILIAVLMGSLYFFMRRGIKARVLALTAYLAKVNIGKDVPTLPGVEDLFSILEDEIYKTVTELREAKQQAVMEKKNHAQSLEDITHQLKTPVTALSITAQMMDGMLPERERTTFQQQLGKMDSLLDTLLTLAKIDAGVLPLKLERVDVYTLLELTVEMLSSQIKEKKIQISLPNHPQVVYMGDLDWSVEAFINLVKNCVEHTSEGGCILFQYTQNPLYTEISITDTGIGFDQKDLPRLFERFYQGERGRKAGAGIGLSMAKSIIEAQNGFISAKNGENGGACFSIRFYCH